MKARSMKMLPLAAALMALSGAASALEFHGYVRSGEGWSDKNGGQSCFSLPGVPGNGNYRLGNECSTYGEAQFDHNLFDGKDGVKFDYHIMFAYTANQNADWEGVSGTNNAAQWALRQNWTEAKNLPFLNGGSAWIGKRYYQRHDAHINDFFYWDTSGPGAGIENFNLGSSGLKASYAIFRRNGQYDTNAAVINGVTQHDSTTTNDFRVSGINLGPAGTLELGLIYDKPDTTITSNTKSGTALIGELVTPVLGGANKFVLTVGQGSANAPFFASPNNVPGNNDGTTGVIDTFQWQASPDFTGMAEVAYYKFKNNYDWTSLGVRPVWHFSDYFKLQFEVGHNAIKPNNLSTATLDHFTVAPTIVAGRGFWARPELRFFYTYNKWNDAARDQWGGVAGGQAGRYGTGTNGSAYGFQLEAWW